MLSFSAGAGTVAGDRAVDAGGPTPLAIQQISGDCDDPSTTITSNGTYELDSNLGTSGSTAVCIYINASNVTLLGNSNTITPSSTGQQGSGTAILIGNESGSIENVTIKNLTLRDWDTGIRAGNGTSGAIEDVTIEGVTVKTQESVTDDSYGIRFDDASNGTINGSTSVSNINGTGVVLESGSNGNVLNESDLSNNEVGVKIEGSSDNVVRKNTISSNTNGTDVVGTASGTTIEDNTIETGQTGVYLSAGSVTVRNNTVSGNSGPGILVKSSSNTFSNNTVQSNRWGVRIVGGSDNNFVNTTFDGNTDWAVSAVQDSSGADAGNNNFSGPNFGFSNGNVSFTLRNANVTETPTAKLPPEKDNQTDIGIFLNATNTTSNGYVDLTINYSASVLPRIEEPTLSIWQFKSSSWSNTSSTLYTGNRTLVKNITSFSVFAPLADPNPEVSQCRVIDKGGDYKVTQDISNDSIETCIDIRASNVDLDGQGHLVDGGTIDAGSVGVSVNASGALSNVTVRNITVTGWDDGIGYGDASGTGVDLGNVTDVVAESNGEDGVVLYNSENVTVNDSRVESNDRDGIRLDGSDNNTLRNNTVVKNTGDGITLLDSSTNVIDDNDVENNTDGIRIYVSIGPSDGNELTSNTVANNSDDGIELDGANDGVMQNNVVRDNAVGVTVTGAKNNSFAGTTLRNNSEWSVDVTSAPGANNFSDADLGFENGTLTFGIRDARLKPEPAAEVPAIPASQDEVGIYINATNTSTKGFLNLTVNYNTTITGDVNESALSIWRNDGSWNDLGGTVDTGARTVSQNVTSFSVIAPLATKTVSECRVIDEEGAYVLTGDITADATSPCIEINVSNVALNGQGHSIDGVDNDLNSVGVVVNASSTLSNVTVRNLTVTGYETGIRMGEPGGTGVTDSLVTNVTATDNFNGTDGAGVAVFASSGVTVNESTFTNDAAGVVLDGTSDSTVADNDVSGADTGILVFGTKGNVVENNTVEGGTDGIDFRGTTGRLEKNEVANASGTGLDLSGSDNTVLNNALRNNTRGLELSGSLNVLENNDFLNNTDGVDLEGSDNLFRGSTFSNNSRWSVRHSAAGSTYASVVNNSFESPDLGFDNGSVSFDLGNVNLRPANESEVPGPPSIQGKIGLTLNATNVTGTSGYLNLTYDYTFDFASSDLIESSLSVWRHSGSWTDLESEPDTTANTLSENVTSFSYIAPLAPNETVTNCGEINDEGSYELDGNISAPSQDVCIEITVSNVTLNGQGHFVKGENNTAGSQGILVEGSGTLTNVSVRDVGVSGWEDGIAFGADDGDGVDVDDGTVHNVTALDNFAGSGGAGVAVTNSTNVVVNDSTVKRNENGIAVGESGTVTVRNNTADGDTVGIRVGAGTSDATVRNNTVRNAADGVVVDAGSNSFENNTLENNDDGVVLESSGNTFTNTTFRGSTTWSIRSVAPATGNEFQTPDFDFVNATVSFTLGNASVLRTTDADRPAAPGSKEDVDVYLNATAAGASPTLDLTVEYERTDPATIEDETLGVWKHNGTWTDRGGSVDEGTDTLTETLGADDFDGTGSEVVFAPLADPAAPNFVVSIVETNEPVVEGEGPLRVNVSVDNTGDVGGTQPVNLSVLAYDGDLTDKVDVDSASTTIGPNNQTYVELVWNPPSEGEDGNYTARVESLNTSDQTADGEVWVQNSQNFSATIERTNSPDSSPQVENGTDVEVEVTVENSGDVGGTQDVVLDIRYRSNGTLYKENVSHRDLTLDRRSSDTFNLSWSTDHGDAGNYTASVRTANDSNTTDVRVYDAPNYVVTIDSTNARTIEGYEDSVIEGQNFEVEVTVENTGDVPGEQTITMGLNQSATGGDQPAQRTNLVLGGDDEGSEPQSKTFTLTWSTVEGDAENYTVTLASANDSNDTFVRVLDSQNFTVNVIDTNSPDVEAEANVEGGENVTVTADITNTGEVSGTQTLNLTIPGTGGTVRDTVDVTLAPGENQTVTFEWETERSGFFGDAGLYEDSTVYSANDSDATTVRVLDSAFFNVSIDDTNSPVVANGTIQVDVTVTNTGEVDDTQTVNMTIPADITRRDNRTVTLNASLSSGESKSFTLNWSTVRSDGNPDPYSTKVTTANDSATTDVTVLRPAELVVVEIVDTNSPVLQGEVMEVTAELQNVGDVDTRQRINLTIGGEVRESVVLRVPARTSRKVTLDWATQEGDAGRYVANVTTLNDTDRRNVSVLEPGATTITLDSTNSPVLEGETMEFTATVENTGDTQETQTVELAVAGAVRDSRQVTLAGRESKTVTLTWETVPGDRGDYQANLSTANDSVRPDVRVNAPSKFAVTIDGSNSAIVEGETLLVNATIVNTGDVEGTETVSLVVDGQERASREVTLGGGENTSVTLAWDTGEGDGGTYTAEVQTGSSSAETAVTIQRPADFEVEVVGTSSPVLEGENLAVTFRIRNVGDLAVTRSVVLTVGGRERATTEVELSGGGEIVQTLTWSTGPGDAGNYTAQVTSGGETATTSATVQAPANFSVSLLSVSSSATVGTKVGAQVRVENVGDLRDNQTVTLSVGAIERSNVTLELAPGENRTVTLAWQTTQDDQGEYTVYISSANTTASFNTTVTPPDDEGGAPTKPNQGPTVDIGYGPGSPRPGQAVRFTAEAEDSDGEIQAIEWRIDGSPGPRSESFTTSFDSSGTYKVKVTVTDDDGANAEAVVTVVVNSPPSVQITRAPSEVRVNNETRFVATASDSDGLIDRATWRINGSIVGTGETLDYAFRQPGTFEVELTVADDDGSTTRVSRIVTVTENEPPEARINYEPSSPGQGETVSFEANAVDSDGEVVEYQWLVDGEIAAETPAFNDTLVEPGDHEVRLVVTDNEGAEATASVNVTVNAPPTAEISISNTTPVVNQSISLSAQAQDQIGEIQRYQWRVDGEVVSTAPTLDYAFEEGGEHEIVLVVTDESGASVQVSQTVTVQREQVERETAGGEVLDVAGGGANIVPVLLVLGVLTLLVLYLYIRFRQLTGAGGDSGGDE